MMRLRDQSFRCTWFPRLTALVLSLTAPLMTGCVDDDPVEDVVMAEPDAKEQAKEHKFDVDEAGRVNFVAEIVYFKFDDSTLTSQGQERLDALATYLKANKQRVLQIQGHCDERGSVQYNLALGEQRAESIKKYLTHVGIDPIRLNTISYGEEKPQVIGHGENEWAQNRRGDFVLTSAQ
jgi:peptidoglycan-associated lipoprotein